MMVYEIIYFEAFTNDQYIWHKNNIAQLYFILMESISLQIYICHDALNWKQGDWQLWQSHFQS